VPPPFAVELLGVAAATAMNLTVVGAGCAGGEELRFSEQRFDGLATSQQRR
jgi:hypothetical protein